MIWVSASLFVGLVGDDEERRAESPGCALTVSLLWRGGCATGDVHRFAVKDSAFGCFQLESLILAQNERWRQA